jgi:hypothetical protein
MVCRLSAQIVRWNARSDQQREGRDECTSSHESLLDSNPALPGKQPEGVAYYRFHSRAST